MKKILSIALIAALVVASAFAGFKNTSASIDLGYNLDTEDYGFANNTAIKYNFGFVLGEEKAEKAGEGDLRAEIAASFKAEFKGNDYTATGDVVAPVVSTLNITKANIIYKDITFGILGAGSSANFAASYYDDDENGSPDVDPIKGLADVPGFTVKYQNINGGFGLNGNSNVGSFATLAYATMSDIELAEGMTASAAVATKLTQASSAADLAYEIQANGAIAYAKEAFSADAAVDFRLADKVGVEVAANAAYDFVSAAVYMVSVDGFNTINLDAMVAASKDIEDISVSAYVDARDILDASSAREIYVGASASATFDAITVAAGADYAIFAKGLGANAKVTYTAEKFVAYAKLVLNANFATSKVTEIAPEVSISSTKVVDGATLALTWKGADFAEGVDKKGAIKFTTTIAL